MSEKGQRSADELEEEPVEVEKEPSVADVQSMQSSSVDIHDLSASDDAIKEHDAMVRPSQSR